MGHAAILSIKNPREILKRKSRRNGLQSAGMNGRGRYISLWIISAWCVINEFGGALDYFLKVQLLLYEIPN